MRVFLGLLLGGALLVVMYIGYIVVYGMMLSKSTGGQVALGVYAPLTSWWFSLLAIVLCAGAVYLVARNLIPALAIAGTLLIALTFLLMHLRSQHFSAACRQSSRPKKLAPSRTGGVPFIQNL